MESWLAGQECALIKGWEGAIDRFYPEESAVWSDPDSQYAALTTKWNTLAALECVDWVSLMQRSDV